MTGKVRYHSRHIPEELLNFNAPMAKDVKRNGLCDCLDGDMPARLRDCGVETMETRLVWWEMEPRSGTLDFSRLARALDKIEKAGMKAGVFPWFQHPPAWYDPDHAAHARFRCLEHDTDSTILSLWDPGTLEVYDRLYGELARQMGGRLAFLYAGISGDFGEVCYPSGVEHYLFSPPHNHVGFWCGDRLARRAFADAMELKYDSIDRLNRTWTTRLAGWDDDLMPHLPIAKTPLPQRRDFAEWYTDSLMSFTEVACGIVRRHFPNLEVAIPLGFPVESLPIGQIKSRAVKAAAVHGITARWTGMAFLGSFERSNVLARRFASPAHFYGAAFATEAALTLTKENAANGLYEAFANGASIIHDDPQNIMRAEEIHKKLRPGLFVSPPTCRAAVLYPLDDELLELEGFDLQQFIDRAAALRLRTDYHICDRYMIEDGFLDGIDSLLIAVPTAVPEETVPKIEAFLAAGGCVWLCGDGRLSVLDEGCRRMDFPIAAGISRTAGWPTIEPVATLAGQGEGFYTVHADCVSRYRPGECAIEMLPASSPGADQDRR